MLNINGIDHININVSNLNNTIKFYKELFGFKVHENGHSAMSGKEYAIIGISNKAFLAIYETKDTSELSRINHIGFNINNFDDVLKVVKENNLEVGGYGDENGIVNYPNSKSIYLYDPDRNEIEISSVFGGGN